MATPTVPTAQPATPLNPFVVEQPEKLDFRRPEEWKRWFTRCERCRVISAVCLSASARKKKSTHQAVLEEVYLGQLTNQRDSGPWRTDVTVNGLPMKFKVDAGADVTAIPTSLYNEQVMGNLKQAKKQLLGTRPDQNRNNRSV
ncbi:hypothetical protein MRX96_038252 [Rhipicephalus microplus]